MPGYDAAVVGGGVIGLAVARRLALEGWRVALVDRQAPGRGASSAAAGMLAPFSESEEPGPFFRFARWSLELYPRLVRELEEETGFGLDFSPSGSVFLALSAEEAEKLEGRAEWQEREGVSLRRLGPGESLRELWGERAETGGEWPEVQKGLLFPEEAHLSPVRLLSSLAFSCLRRGVDFLLSHEVVGGEREGEQLEALCLSNGERVSASVFILAAGAWLGVLADRLGARLPVRPVRGQILSLRAEGGGSRRILFTAWGYLLSKPEGEVWVGATEDEAGFSPEVNLFGLAYLAPFATRLAPHLLRAPLVRVWAGLRPATPDLLPLIGPVPGFQNVFAAGGHHRNGILLAPATAEAMAAMVMKKEVPEEVTPFSPQRFGG
jgi:glycine oxidase